MALHHRYLCRGADIQAALGPSVRCPATGPMPCSRSSGGDAWPAGCRVAGRASGAGSPAPAARRLILLRHADSEAAGSVRDHDRPISAQRRQEAASIAKRLAATGWLPDVILASNSRRTKDTLDAMTEVISQLAEADAHFLGSLYTVAALDGQTRSHLEECIRGIVSDKSSTTIMCVGHNKGWEEAASHFMAGNT